MKKKKMKKRKKRRRSIPCQLLKCCWFLAYQHIVRMELTAYSHQIKTHTLKESHVQLRVHRLVACRPEAGRGPPIERNCVIVFTCWMTLFSNWAFLLAQFSCVASHREVLHLNQTIQVLIWKIKLGVCLEKLLTVDLYRVICTKYCIKEQLTEEPHSVKYSLIT